MSGSRNGAAPGSPPGGLGAGVVCHAPPAASGRVELGHGSGGTMSARLVAERFLPRFANRFLEPLADGACLPPTEGELVVSTDTFVVDPLEFPGGNIGHLAVHGTLNDVAMMGGRPAWLTAAFVLEEGLAFDVLDRILDAMAEAADEAGVPVVAADTKVVERGKGDGLFVCTTGVGVRLGELRPDPGRAGPGDAVLLSGPVGRHGMAVMACREGFDFETGIRSDTAHLFPLVDRLRGPVGADVHVLRDATRGGVATALNEIAGSSGVGVLLEEARIPVPPDVEAACEMLGLDPLYVANEGVMVAIVSADRADVALDALREHPTGAGAVRIGTVVEGPAGTVLLRTGLGGTRIVDRLPGDPLPRIC